MDDFDSFPINPRRCGGAAVARLIGRCRARLLATLEGDVRPAQRCNHCVQRPLGLHISDGHLRIRFFFLNIHLNSSSVYEFQYFKLIFFYFEKKMDWDLAMFDFDLLWRKRKTSQVAGFIGGCGPLTMQMSQDKVGSDSLPPGSLEPVFKLQNTEMNK